MEVRILLSAENDLQGGYDFYEKQSLGLGDYFYDTLYFEIGLLQRTAGIHSKRGNLFRVMSKKFPYRIYYQISDFMVYVRAVLDARQDPSKIQQREKKEQQRF